MGFTCLTTLNIYPTPRRKVCTDPPRAPPRSCPPTRCAETLRQALAMGADRAIHVTTDARMDQELLPLGVAKARAGRRAGAQGRGQTSPAR